MYSVLQLMVNFQFFLHFNSEPYLQHRPITGEGESHVKYSTLRNDSGEEEILDNRLFPYYFFQL